jgi:type I restriction enzyme S subunit
LKACYYQNAINRVRARTSASTKFLYYWLFNLKHAGFIDAAVSRITIAHLTVDKLERVPWPDVSSTDQKNIATYLDASCAAIDAAVAAKLLQLETLDEIRRTTLHSVFAHDDWPIERIKDVVIKIGSGVTPEGGASSYVASLHAHRVSCRR